MLLISRGLFHTSFRIARWFKLAKLKTRGATQICRCTHTWTKVLKYTPKHILVKMQNSPPKQGFCLKFDPLNRFESKKFELILTKPPLFPETWYFRPLNAFLALRVLLQKRPLFTCFSVHACVHQYMSAPLPPELKCHKKVRFCKSAKF